MRQLSEQKGGIAKVIDLLKILQIMSGARNYELLSSRGFSHSPVEEECERMNLVYKYILDNYVRNPSLSDVSRFASMSTAAFCKYFKSRTNKTYTQFLNEIKIGNACKLLIENKISISQISFKIGFNNLTHFNSQFKRIIGLTPTQYQHQHLKEIFLPE